MTEHDDFPWFEKSSGRWLCANSSQAMDCLRDHPGDHDRIYTFERDSKGNMFNITKFESKGEHPIQGVKSSGGRTEISWRK